jgi:cell division protein FtsL
MQGLELRNKANRFIAKIKKLSGNEKLLIVLLIISTILVVSSWDRISEKTKEVFHLYIKGRTEKEK